MAHWHFAVVGRLSSCNYPDDKLWKRLIVCLPEKGVAKRNSNTHEGPVPTVSAVSLGHGHEWEETRGPYVTKQKKAFAAILMRDRYTIEKQQLT